MVREMIFRNVLNACPHPLIEEADRPSMEYSLPSQRSEAHSNEEADEQDDQLLRGSARGQAKR